MKSNQLYKVVELRNSGYKVRWATRSLKEGEKMYTRLREIKPHSKFILYDNDKIILENDDVDSERSDFSDTDEEITNVRKYSSDTNYESDSNSESSSESIKYLQEIKQLEEIKRKNFSKNLYNMQRVGMCDSFVMNLIIVFLVMLLAYLIQFINNENLLN